MLKHNIAREGHPLMWVFALIITLSLWASTAMAQVYDNGDTTQSTPTIENTSDTSGAEASTSTMDSSTTGLPTTGAGGLANDNLALLSTALFLVGAGALIIRRSA